MPALLHHVALALAATAVVDAGMRTASLAAPCGLERVVAGVVIAASAGALGALALGLVGLGTNPIALVTAAALAWAAAHRLLPDPQTPLLRELGRFWSPSPLGTRIAAGALAGAWLIWAAWLQRYPALGIDSVSYHLPEVVGWIDNGRPGSVVPVFPNLPVGNYPLTNEVLLSAGMGVARSFVWASLWIPLMLALMVAAGWGALRRWAVPRWGAALALGALSAIPALTHYQMNGANTDLPALAWLVSAGFLAQASVRHPALLAPAVLAAGLAVGTKTTTLPLATVVVALAAYANRAELRGLARPLAVATGVAALVGGYWYARNLVDHGSPLWPFVATPWGDPLPVDFGPRRGVNASFLDVPRATLDQVGDRWLQLFGSGFLLLAGSVLAAVIARRRAVWAATAAAAGALALWANSPFTGASNRGFDVATASTVRYLLPAVTAAALALALSTASSRRSARAVGGVVLALALALGLKQTFDLGFPSVPSPLTLLVGAVLGSLVMLALTVLARRAPSIRERRGGAAAALAAVLAGAIISVPATGYVQRHAAAATTYGAETTRWLASRSSFRDGKQTVIGAPVVLGPLAGDRLQHPFAWLAPGTPCEEVRARARTGYLLLLELPSNVAQPSRSAPCLRAVRPAFRGAGLSVYGG